MGKRFSVLFVFLFLVLAGSLLNAQESKRSEIIREYNAACRLHNELKNDESVSALKEIVRKYPNFPPAYAFLAQIYLWTDKLDQGEEYFQSLVQQNSQNPLAWYGLGWISQWRKNYDQAIEYGKKCAQLMPAFFGCYDVLNESFINRESAIAEAIDYLKGRILANPDSPGPYYGLGGLYTRMNLRKLRKEWGGVMQVFSTGLEKARAIKDWESEMAILSFVGRTYGESLFDYEKGIDFLERALMH